MKIFICDDDSKRRAETARLACEFARVIECTSGEDLLVKLKQDTPDLIFMHLILRDTDGLGLLAQIRHVPIVMTMETRSRDMVKTAIAQGAADCVFLPLDQARFEIILMQQSKISALLRDKCEEYSFEARGERMQAVLKTASKAALSPLPLLISGSDQSGKTRLAKRIHALSGSDKAFTIIDCEGFKGAFTLSGTVFFKNIDRLSPLKQKVLVQELNALPKKNPPRLMASCSDEILEKVRQAAFLSELYYYFSITPLRMPSVKEREEDLPALYSHFMLVEAAKLCRAPIALPDLTSCSNFYQAKNRIREALIGGGQPFVKTPIETDDLPLMSHGKFQPFEVLEREIYMKAYAHLQGNLSEIAKALKVGRSTVYRKFADYGVAA